MHLSKHHGLGNDFLVAFVASVPPDAPARARRLCHRTEGVGADGLILLTPGEGDSDATMTLLNADGSLAEISGNGLRCVAQALARRDGASAADYLVATAAGTRGVAVVSSDGAQAEVAAEMGAIESLELADATELVTSLTGASRAGAASVGNPHVVALVEHPYSVDLEAVGGAVDAAVDGGSNVEFIRAIDRGPGAIELSVWERGAGATRACGTGACAGAWYANRWGLVGEVVDVLMPGGRATVHLGPTVSLVGPATHVAEIEVP